MASLPPPAALGLLSEKADPMPRGEARLHLGKVRACSSNGSRFASPAKTCSTNVR
jgi:hypothetical protein